MKVVQLYNQYRATFGGEYTVIENTSALLKEHGHQVIAATRSSRNIGDSVVRKIAATINGVYSLSGMAEMARLIENERPDIVHAHNIYPHWSPSVFRMCTRKGIPTVLHVHSHFLTCPNWYHVRNGNVCERCAGGHELSCLTTNCRGSFAESAAYALRSYVARAFDLFTDNVSVFVTVSHFQRRRLIAAGFPPERVVVLHNSVPAVPAGPDVTPGEGEYIAYCGRLSPEKGVGVLLDAARRTDLPVVIAGDGPERELLQRVAPPNVTFLGRLGRSELSTFYRNCKFLVFPSLCLETFGMVAAEAMSYAKPVVGTRIGAIPEIVTSGTNGILVEPGDSMELASQMAALWADSERCQRLGRAGQDMVKAQFGPDKYYAGLLSAYQLASHFTDIGTDGSDVWPPHG